MYVLKRDGRKESVMFDKITSRIKKLCHGLNMEFIDPPVITMKVISGLYPGVTTAELDSLAAEVAISKMTVHPDYAVLAARIAVSNLQKETKQVFSDVVDDLYLATDEHTGYRTPLISEEIYQIIKRHSEELNSAITYDKDFNYSYFGFKALEKSYLLRINGKVVERPQHMLMRVAVGIHKEDIDAVLEMYRLMSDKWFIFSCSTLFHAGLPNTQLSSSFVLTAIEDSVEGIYETLKRSAVISKKAGGVGLSVHNIRAKGTHIAGTGGCSNGLAPMLKLFNDTQCFIDECGNKHLTGCTVYLEPWHADIFEFLNVKKRNGESHHLNYALWIPDLFMQRVKNDGVWSLMCPHESPGLSNVWGEEFENLYNRYEKEGKCKSKIRAQDLWIAIIQSQIDTGFPYILYKDSCNLKSNHQHLGTVKCGSINANIVEYSSPSKVAVCNVASLALEKFVKDGCYDFQMLKEITKSVTFSLNKIIDVTHYPLTEAKEFATLYRPLGIGVQGLADAFILMKYPFGSEEAQRLNIHIFETIYYAALEASCELAERFGPHEEYEGSPVSKGLLQYDMWNVTPTDLWDWSALKQKISQFGLRNSLLISLSPTVHAAEILGNNESTSPVINNIWTKHTYFGTFEAINTHLLKDLNDRGLWNEAMKDELIRNKGSVQNIDCVPGDMKLLYRTVWELPQKIILKMTADRGAFVDQSQSINIYFAEPTYEKMTSMLFYGWTIGLKTGMSSLHTPQLSANQQSIRKRKPSPSEIKNE